MHPEDVNEEIEDLLKPARPNSVIKIVRGLLKCEVISVDSYRSKHDVSMNDDRYRVVLTFEKRANRGLVRFFKHLLEKREDDRRTD